MTTQTTSSKIQDINRQMLDLYFNEGWSKARICSDPRFNRSPHTLETLIREARKRGRTRKKIAKFDARARVNWKVLSPAHAKLGVLITRHMATHKMGATQFGLLVNMTRNKVSMMQAGSFDPNLMTLLLICKVIDIKPQDIFQGMHNGPISATPS